MKTLRLCFAFALLFSATVVQAQDSCSDLMKFGIYDEFSTLSSQESFKLFQILVV